MTLRIDKRFVNEIVQHAESSPLKEICGILVGKICEGNRVVKRVYKAKNIHQLQFSSYLIDPEEQYQIFGIAETDGIEVIGFYHSHPNWPASVSETDLRDATYPSLSYIIYSVLEKDLKSYIFHEEKFFPEPIEVIS